MPPQETFKDSLRVDMLVNELYPMLNAGVSYNRLNGSAGGAVFECVSDLAVYTPFGGSTNVNNFITGGLNAASNSGDARWAELYQWIRKANVVLKYIDFSVMSEARKQQKIAEAKFLKAYFHYELFRRHGSIPIMDDLLDLEGDIHVPRASFEEMIDYMVRLIDEAAEILPVRYPSNDYGRMTKGSAYGLKSRILLVAASPLHNENPMPGSIKETSYPEPDKERWKKAADAALQCIELKNSDGSPAHELYPSFERTFFTRIDNWEGLIMKQNSMNNSVEKADGPVGFQNARGNTNATQELVDMFEMKATGKLPGEEGSGYDPQNPYAGRCNRFYATIFYNGSSIWGREIETFVGGADYPASPGVKGCNTGYVMRKHIDPTTSIVSPEKTTFHDWPVLRFAEVLLNYAEAMNEYLGLNEDDIVTDEKIYEYVNKVRQRAGLPNVDNLTKAQMRTLVQRERTVELAFEDQRYHDLRRWRLAEVALNRPVHGAEIIKVGSDYTYNFDKEIENRVFPMRHYFYPIPQTELDKNMALVKNPGW
ncbi:MAG: RagB/SusD family nutrient uptake outer membrane protein [Bacteroidales bacterium]|nr:RagB/SusD family nutrient uptake outer membrane protein [Bacteroidales bacterium]